VHFRHLQQQHLGGPDGYGSSTVEQTGIDVSCVNGTTQGWQHVVNASRAGAARSSAEALVADPSDVMFTPIHFTGVTVDGSQLGSLRPVKITGSDSRIVVSPVSGSSFSASWTTPTSQLSAEP
jgi:hypothetical protein